MELETVLPHAEQAARIGHMTDQQPSTGCDKEVPIGQRCGGDGVMRGAIYSSDSSPAPPLPLRHGVRD